MPSFLRRANIGIEGALLLGAEDNFLDGAVIADSSVIGAAQMDGMQVVVQHMLPGRNGRRGDQVRHEIDADVSAPIRQRSEKLRSAYCVDADKQRRSSSAKSMPASKTF
jgi:hypothetical protein